jgi:hypothetical protein
MKKGQLQTMEPIIIVIVLVIIIGICLLFYSRISNSQEDQQIRTAKAKEDTATLKRIANLPEFSCGRSTSTNTYCIDKYKAEAFGNFTASSAQARIYYYGFFGAANVTLQIIENGNLRSIPLYYNLNSTYVTQTRTYFTVFDPVMQHRQFAILIIEREQ